MISLSRKILDGDDSCVLPLYRKFRSYPLHTDLRDATVHKAVRRVLNTRPMHSVLLMETWFCTVGPRYYDVLK